MFEQYFQCQKNRHLFSTYDALIIGQDPICVIASSSFRNCIYGASFEDLDEYSVTGPSATGDFYSIFNDA